MTRYAGRGWKSRLRKDIKVRNAMLDGKPANWWKPWPNTLPRHLRVIVDRLVDFHDHEGSEVLGAHDLAVIIAQAAYDSRMKSDSETRKKQLERLAREYVAKFHRKPLE